MLSTIKGTFKTVHQYLQHIYSKDKGQLQDQDMHRGVKAIMLLADEAVDKLQRCTSLFRYTHADAGGHTEAEGQIDQLQEYDDLRHFYIQKLLKRFEEVFANEAVPKENWDIEENQPDIEKQGLRDLDMVKEDRQYELFYIRKDDGKPLFNRNLLRHIKLVSDFDDMVMGDTKDDPLLRINTVFDHEALLIAQEIQGIASQEIKQFYLHALPHKDIPIVGNMIKITMSLMLASNPHNLHEHTTGKVCVHYLEDFQQALRTVLGSSDYTRLIEHPIEKADKITKTLLYLIHALAFAFFGHGGKKQETLNYMYSLLRSTNEKQLIPHIDNIDTHRLISDLFDRNDAITKMLKSYPNGPLFKTLDIFQERQEKVGFDPISQNNLPHYLFTMKTRSFETQFLKMPCPTLHTHINQATIVNEFKGFLRYFEMHKNFNKHLHFNLQDSTSWEEHARCQALEHCQNQAEFSKQMVLVTFPKKTDFYFQSEDYLHINDVQDFLQLIKEQVSSEQECGFFFSKLLSKKVLYTFVDGILPLIHACFFEEKPILLRKERLDFIEIFYQFFFLKIIDIVKPHTLTFSCKDGIDIGATTHFAFCILTKLLGSGNRWSCQDQGHLYWMLCGPAITVRERLVDFRYFNRIASGLSVLEQPLTTNHTQILKSLSRYYEEETLQDIDIIYKR